MKTYLEDEIPMSREEKKVIGVGVMICILLICCLTWMAFTWGDLHGRGKLLVSAQDDIRQGLERIQAQNAIAYAVSEDSKAKAVESARRLRELADTMPNANPFKGR